MTTEQVFKDLNLSACSVDVRDINALCHRVFQYIYPTFIHLSYSHTHDLQFMVSLPCLMKRKTDYFIFAIECALQWSAKPLKYRGKQDGII